MKVSAEFLVADWLLNLPLYTPVVIDTTASATVRAILTYVSIIDFYCPACKKFTPFQGVLSTETQNSIVSERMAVKGFGVTAGFWLQKKFSKELSCKRAEHKVTFHFQIEDDKLLKVGQYPSIAEINFGDALEFAKALGNERAWELNKAIELASGGSGLGAYIYLKKVFESLLADAHQKAILNKTWDDALYPSAAVADKVKLLAKYLPSFLIEHQEHYSILDRSLHELSDKECLNNFNALKTAILVMADERLAAITKSRRLLEAAEIIK
ncbi:MAG: hypothetical protein ACAH10_06185 [Methylophilaceae bacterium]